MFLVDRATDVTAIAALSQSLPPDLVIDILIKNSIIPELGENKAF